jgi:hypothetical protein
LHPAVVGQQQGGVELEFSDINAQGGWRLHKVSFPGLLFGQRGRAFGAGHSCMRNGRAVSSTCLIRFGLEPKSRGKGSDLPTGLRASGATQCSLPSVSNAGLRRETIKRTWGQDTRGLSALTVLL